MAKHRIKKNASGSASFRKIYGKAQTVPRKVSRKRVFVKV